MDIKLENIDYLSGNVRWIENELQEDMLLVAYPNNYILDMGWYKDRFIIYIIRDNEWRCPVVSYSTHNENKLMCLLKQAVQRVDEEAKKSTPYCGELWETETIDL